MPAPYIPTKDALLVPWEANFSTLITANPPLYGLVTGDAVAIAAAYSAYNSSYTLSIDPSTRTKVTVNAKNIARNSSLVTMRGYAALIRVNQGVSSSDKTSLGLTVPDPTPTPVPPPTSSPLLTFVAGTPFQHTIRYADQNTPASRKKPSGVKFLQVSLFVGTVAPVSPAATPYYGLVTKNPVAIDFEAGDVGKTAFYYARWLNTKGQPGPWSALMQATVLG